MPADIALLVFIIGVFHLFPVYGESTDDHLEDQSLMINFKAGETNGWAVRLLGSEIFPFTVTGSLDHTTYEYFEFFSRHCILIYAL